MVLAVQIGGTRAAVEPSPGWRVNGRLAPLRRSINTCLQGLNADDAPPLVIRVHTPELPQRSGVYKIIRVQIGKCHSE